MIRNAVVIFVAISSALGVYAVPTVGCNHRDAFRCASGECILRFEWCDGVNHCSDFSDEDFCYGGDCLEDHFQCKNGRCIPLSGFCDNYADCTDGSDEVNCGGSLSEEIKPSYGREILSTDEIQSVSKAANFFLAKMTENGWRKFTPRAAIALSFADRALPINEEEKYLMIKQLNIYLRANLIQKKISTLSDLAFAINALYATCQDPRNFNGEDLVGMLRWETNKAMRTSNFEYPVVLMTLCIADLVENEDMDRLTDMYRNNNIISFRALAIMAMACIAHKTGNNAQWESDYFMTNNQSIKDADTYTKALYLQAAYAAGYTPDVQLLNHQLSDGSFGDMLTTYSAVPALLKSSLLDLRCNTSKHEELHARNQITNEKGKKLIYSLWIKTDTGINTHQMVIRYEGNLTFYDIMLMAADRDPLYRFLHDETAEGKQVYSLAGIPNDPETKKSWELFEATADMRTVQSPHYMTKNNLGVDRIYPKNKANFIFCLKRESDTLESRGIDGDLPLSLKPSL